VPHVPPRVLVVDDIADIRTLIRMNLELEGFAVSQAGNGLECLAIVNEVDPDLITLDAGMPVMDGFRTAAHLRTRAATAHIPLVMVTARAQGSDVARGTEVGVDAYVTKPFDPAELVRRIRELVVDGTSQSRR
jgi:DNA-binding response OmpR family regulator